MRIVSVFKWKIRILEVSYIIFTVPVFNDCAGIPGYFNKLCNIHSVINFIKITDLKLVTLMPISISEGSSLNHHETLIKICKCYPETKS